MDWKLIGKSLAKGLLFAFGMFILSGSDSSLGLGLMIAYMDYRLERFEKMAKGVE